MMFADDPLLFARADHSSITKIMDAFHKFFTASGLEASVEKSSIYLAGVSDDDKIVLADLIHMPLG